MNEPTGWYRASDGNWYYGTDPKPYASPPMADGNGGWHAAVPLPPPPPSWPTTEPNAALRFMSAHKVLTAVGAFVLLGLVGNAIGEEPAEKKPVAVAPVVAEATTAPPETEAPAPVATTTPPKPRPTTVAPTTRAPLRIVSPPKPKPTTKAPAPVRTTVAAPRTDPHFGTCREAIAHGYGPYVQGRDEEYDWYRDADSDGVVCER